MKRLLVFVFALLLLGGCIEKADFSVTYDVQGDGSADSMTKLDAQQELDGGLDIQETTSVDDVLDLYPLDETESPDTEIDAPDIDVDLPDSDSDVSAEPVSGFFVPGSIVGTSTGGTWTLRAVGPAGNAAGQVSTGGNWKLRGGE